MADPTVPVAPASQAVQAAVVKELNQVLAAIGTVQALPANLPTPDRAVVLTGTVLPPPPQPGNGQGAPQSPVAIIQTALGTLTLALTAALPPGPITVQIQPGSPPTAAVLVTPPAGQPAATANPTTSQVAAPPPVVDTPVTAPITQALPATTAPPATVGQVLAGTFTPTPTPVAAAPAVGANPAPAPAAAPIPAQPPALSPLAASSPLLAQEAASEDGSLGTTLVPAAPVVSVSQVYLVVGVTPPGVAAGASSPVAQAPAPANAAPSSTPSQATPVPATIALPGAALPLAATSPSAPVQPPPGKRFSGPAGAVAAPPATVVPGSPQPSPTPAAASPLALAPTSPELAAAISPAAAGTSNPAAAGSATVANAPAAPASIPTSSSTPPSPASPIAATVVASTSGQQPVLAVPNGVIFISQPVAVHTGTTLSLQVLTPGQAGSLQPALPGQPAPIGRESWPALQQALVSLAGTPLAASAVARFIPTLGQDFVSTFAAYLTKAGGGEKPSGEDVVTILRNLTLDEAAAPGLRAALGLLQGEVLGKSVTPAAQGWQNFPVPVLTDQGLTLIQLYLHQQVDSRQDEADLKSTPHNTTRFLLEVHPSALGPVQLDGLLRKDARPAQPAPDHLDLIVRSEAGIPGEDARELQGLFINALEASGLTGRLNFQAGRENFIQPASGVGGQVEVKA